MDPRLVICGGRSEATAVSDDDVDGESQTAGVDGGVENLSVSMGESSARSAWAWAVRDIFLIPR